jgi:atlastin
MDTQGTFDSNSTVFENAFIFALTLLVSSVTVYNIMHNLQEDNLQHLSFFAEYGVLALDAYHTSPFQVGEIRGRNFIRKICFLAINISCT